VLAFAADGVLLTPPPPLISFLCADIRNVKCHNEYIRKRIKNVKRKLKNVEGKKAKEWEMAGSIPRRLRSWEEEPLLELTHGEVAAPARLTRSWVPASARLTHSWAPSPARLTRS
jgi:hypothetical protein